MLRKFDLAGGGSFTIDCNPMEHTSEWALNYYVENGQIPEPEVVNLMAKVVRPGDLVVDGGANIGFFTLLLSRLVGEEGRVLSIEPGRNNISRLNQNIGRNKAFNVTVFTRPLAATCDKATFYVRQDAGSNSLAEGEGDPVEVETTTLDSICYQPVPRLIKLDLEGAELSALKGAHHLFERGHRPFITTELNVEALQSMGATVQDLRRYMRKWQYDVFALPEKGGLPILIPRATLIQPTRQNTNVLFAPLDLVGRTWTEVQI